MNASSKDARLAYRVQAGGGPVHVWGAFHSVAKSPLLLPDRYLIGELYRGILPNTLVPFTRQHFRDNCCYQDNNATPHRAQLVLDFLQQGNVTEVEQPARSPDCSPIEHIWDELGRAITSMDTPPQNLRGLRQALLDKQAKRLVERLVASMPRRLMAIITASGWKYPILASIHKTTPTGSITENQVCLTDQIYHNYHPMTFRYTHAANFSNIHKCHPKFTKIHIKQNSA